ncbi:biliverdin-producing heme oxygenase [Sphingomonas alba]|uniref:Biliverdin-producing heme oxygenase n=1 Tax=Sphingomonas alba TaxID=2908208 RepID=A0ABT0RP61_9SPHN|nr:biliverdin-producing heme oxygenase [Sphingomonas alba]MCL6684417.1 biliverdin-producing heme oxygenase [Sphingomonas alba]
MTNRFVLKAATDDVHRELDDRLSQLNLATAEDYGRFLGFQARTVPAIEGALAAAGLASLVTGWEQGRRSEALRSDLSSLGQPMPQPAAPPSISTTAEALGAAYVLEGSRLGGRVLRGRVGKGLPARFLGEGQHNSWPHVVAALDRLLGSEADLDAAKQAARRTFAFFLDAAGEAGL